MRKGRKGGRKEGRMEGRKDGRMEGWKEGRKDGRMLSIKASMDTPLKLSNVHYFILYTTSQSS